MENEKWTIKKVKNEKEANIIKNSCENGKYILEDIEDFRLIKKINHTRDIYLSPTPTNIYASLHGKKYHTSKNCPYGKRLKDESIIYFYSEDDAKALGYEKCKWCEKHSD